MRELTAYPDAIAKLQELSLGHRVEERELDEATGLSLAEDVHSSRDFPPFFRATMDGYAVRAESYNSLSAKKMVCAGTLLAGHEFTAKPDSAKCLRIMTGAAVPDPYNAVVEVEKCHVESDDQVLFELDSVDPYRNISKKGEDLQKGKPLLKAGSVIYNGEIGALAANGNSMVRVFAPPKVKLITTGSEVIDITCDPSPYQIRNSNKHTLLSLLSEYKIQPEATHIGDDPDATKAVLTDGAPDFFIFTGGVSMGTADFVHGTLRESGVETVFHKVAIKPGKPVYIGQRSNQIFVGLPGNPMSAQVAYRLFAVPLIRKFMRLNEIDSFWFPSGEERSRKISRTSKQKRDEFLPVFFRDARELAFIKRNGSGDIRTSAGSQGLIRFPADVEKIERGQVVQFFPWRRV